MVTNIAKDIKKSSHQRGRCEEFVSFSPSLYEYLGSLIKINFVTFPVWFRLRRVKVWGT